MENIKEREEINTMIYETKKINRKERLQIFANNYVRKNTMRILLGLLIALATIACPGRAAPTFPYVCPNGTPTEGMIATENTISCSDCNTGFNRIDTRCINDCTGTAIATPAELMNIAATGDFHLTSDIDLTGVTWTPKAFNGCLNGKGNVISNLSLALPLMDGDGNTLSEYGLFSILEESAMIQNLGLEDVNITGMSTDSFEVGSFAGINGGTIRTSYAHGQITITTTNSSTLASISDETRNQGQRTGGLVGLNTGSIQGSYAHVSIGSESVNSGTGVGGLVGHNSAGTIENSFATGGASSFVSGQNQVGGLVGRHQIVSFGGSRSASIANSYSIAIQAHGGSINGDREGSMSGGLVGLSEGYSPSSLNASIANSYSATQPIGASLLGGLVADANSDYDDDDSNKDKETTFTGKNYYTTIDNGISNGLGDGSCVAANCIQATGSTNGQRRSWLADTLSETDLGWSANVWNNLGMTGWPCLKKISNIFSGKDGCPPMAPFICPGGTATVGSSVTGGISCQSCTPDMGYKMVGSECVRFESHFSRIGTADNFGVGETAPRGLASITDDDTTTLYMVGAGRRALYTLDTSSGIATQVGMASDFGIFRYGGDVADLASIDTTLYMVDTTLAALFKFNTTTGIAMQVGSADFGVGENQPLGLASIDNTLYMVGAGRRALYTLDITPDSSTLGQATQVGSANAGFGVGERQPVGLASIDNTLYMVGAINDVLYTLDTDSGLATRVGATTDFGVGEENPRGLASIGNTLYMTGSTNSALYKAEVPE